MRRVLPLVRPVVALLSPLLLLGLAFATTAAIRLRGQDLPRDAVRAALEPVAWLPTSIGFGLVLLCTGWCARRDGMDWRTVGWCWPRAAHLLLGATVGLTVAVLDALWLHPWVRASIPAFDPALATQPALLVAGVLVVSIVAEDTLFRGYALLRLRAIVGMPLATLASTLAYAPLAGIQGAALVLWAIGFGLVLCVLRLWAGSLWPVVLAHGIVAFAPRLQSELARIA